MKSQPIKETVDIYEPNTGKNIMDWVITGKNKYSKTWNEETNDLLNDYARESSSN